MAKKKKDNSDNIMNLVKSQYIRSFFKMYALSYIIGIIVLVTINYLQTKVPILFGNVIDGLETNTITIDIIKITILSIGIIAILIASGRIFWRLFIFGAARKIERDIRNDIFSHLEKLSQTYFNKHQTGEIMAYITNDLEALRNALGPGVLLVIDVVTLLALTLFNMFVNIDVSLTLIAVLPLILIAVITTTLGKILFKRFSDRQSAYAKVSDFVQEDISGIKVVKAFVQEKEEIEAFDKENKNYYKSNIKLMRLETAMRPLMQAVSGMALAVALGYGGYLATHGAISIGDLITFIQYLGMLVWPMMAIGMAINHITRGSAALKRIQSVFDEEIDIFDSPNAKEPSPFTGDISVNNLTFTYPETETVVLENISFSLKKGEMLGIVGRTGSGKTTLVNLLLRLYNVEDNTILISGSNISDIPLKTLRANIGYVPQDTFLFSDTIKNNIDFSDGNKTFEEITKAAEFACVHDNIIDFKEQYETLVGERGVTLSGGQKQRISIARAFIKDPEILILDDSVSAVDTDTEEKILNNIKTQRAGKTTIIIAHRISTLQNADKIIVLDEGKIIEHGTHSELVSNNGLYNSLYQKQLLEKMINEEEA